MIKTKPCNPKNIKITLLKGGTSGEREISLQSGDTCAQALRAEGFTVTEIDTADKDALECIKASSPDLVFIALHGRDGEDGKIQRQLEELHLLYTGSGVAASAAAMDKAQAKEIYRKARLRTPAAIVLKDKAAYKLDTIVQKLSWPCVVKPAHEGSSLGVNIVYASTFLGRAIKKTFRHDSTVLVEQFIEGTELTIAVLGNEDIEALPVIEIVPHSPRHFYDYQAKYSPGGCEHIIPARIDDDLAETCQRMAIAAHRALGCRGVSRSDIILDKEKIPWLIETNTIPGMTKASLLPDAAACVGINFNKLCRMLIELAFE